jgi:hypothetical protein
VVKIVNDVLPESYVDYKHIYYYNVSRPWIGSSQASIKLASDGTMTEGSGQQESKTLQAFLDLLPIKEVFSAAAKGAMAVAPIDGGGPLKGTAKYELSTDVKTLKHTHYVIDESKQPPCPAIKEDVGVKDGYNLLVEDVSESKKSPPKDNEIGISGSIQLPKTTPATATPASPPK